MKSTKIIGAILIFISMILGYLGYSKISNSSNSVSVVGIKIEASNESGKNEGYLFLGGAVFLLVGGIYMLRNSKN